MQHTTGSRPERTMTRRRFIESSAGVVAATVLMPRLMAQEAQAGAASATPGVATQRIEGLAKVTGEKIFARDFNAQDMGWPQNQCYAMLLRATTTQQAFLGIDRASLPAPAQNARLVLGNELSAAMRAPNLVHSRDLMVENRMGSFDRPEELVYDLIVQPGNVPNFLGQAVALLVFDDAQSFRAARNAMRFRDQDFQRYGPPPGPLPPARVPIEPHWTYVKYFEDQETFSYVNDPKASPTTLDAYRAKIEQRLKALPGLTRHSFSSQMRAMDPMFMEPETGLAWLDGKSGTLHLVLGTQSPDGDISNITSMYQSADAPVQLNAVELTSCYPGGGFGGRDSSPFSLMLALAAAYCGGRPVRLQYDRFEQFQVGLKRHGAELWDELAVTPDMKLQSVAMALELDSGGRRNLSPYVANLAALCAGGAYKLSMANIFAQAYHSQNVSGGSQRGFGGPQAFFGIETALDDIAHLKGWDPIALRRANIAAKGDTTVVGGAIDQELRLDEMLTMTEHHPLWANRAQIKAEHASNGALYGTGVAMSMQAYGTSGDGMVAAVLMDAQGAFTVQSAAVDMGNGSATTLGVVIGDILGANATHVDMGADTLFRQTGLNTDHGGSWADPNWSLRSVSSSSACLTALHQVHVVQEAARALMISTLLPAAARAWGLPSLRLDETNWAGGALHFKPGGKAPLALPYLAQTALNAGLPRGVLAHGVFQNTWVEADYPIAEASHRLKLDSVALYPATGAPAQPLLRSNTQAPPSDISLRGRYVWAPCVNIVGLQVNPATGQVQIENVVSVLNAGRIHVPELVSGQSQGGVAMAIGYTLMEDMPPGLDGPANGTWNLNRYHLAHAQDVPLATRYTPSGRAQELIILPETPGDQKQGRGIAEAVMCSIPPAISNALRDATGTRFTSLPITAEKIRKALHP